MWVGLVLACTATTPPEASPSGATADTGPAPVVTWEVSTITSELGAMDGIAVGADGTVYVTDFLGDGIPGNPAGNTVVRVASDGTVEVLDATVPLPLGVAIAPDGVLHVASWSGRGVFRLEGETATPFSVAADNVSNVAFAPDGTLLVTNFNQNTIDRIDASGARLPAYTDDRFNGVHGLAFDDEGQLFVGNYWDGRLFRIQEDGSVQRLARLPDDSVLGYLTWLDGALYATANSLEQVYRITPEGDVTRIAGTGASGGDDGPGLEATFEKINGIAADPTRGRLLVSEGVKRLRALTPTIASE